MERNEVKILEIIRNSSKLPDKISPYKNQQHCPIEQQTKKKKWLKQDLSDNNHKTIKHLEIKFLNVKVQAFIE